MKNLFLVLMAGSLLVLSSCLRTDEPDYYETIEGSVVHNGAPLQDADVHIRLHYEPGGFSEGDADPVKIEFETQVPEFIIGELFFFRGSEPFATFFSDSLSDGEHTLTIPDSLLSNGIYAYNIRTEENQGFSGLIVMNKPDSLLPGTLPLAETNAEGEFAISPAFLGLGNSFESEERGTFAITDSLEFIITTGDSIFATQKVRVKPNTGNFFEISGN